MRRMARTVMVSVLERVLGITYANCGYVAGLDASLVSTKFLRNTAPKLDGDEYHNDEYHNDEYHNDEYHNEEFMHVIKDY